MTDSEPAAVQVTIASTAAADDLGLQALADIAAAATSPD